MTFETRNFNHPIFFGLFILTKCNNLGADELKRAKIDVKMSIFLQFLLYLSMWCHFSSMWIIESCAYWIIWILNNQKWIFKQISISKFDLNKRCLTISFNDTTFIKSLLIFIIQFISSSSFYINKVLLDTFK